MQAQMPRKFKPMVTDPIDGDRRYHIETELVIGPIGVAPRLGLLYPVTFPNQDFCESGRLNYEHSLKAY